MAVKPPANPMTAYPAAPSVAAMASAICTSPWLPSADPSAGLGEPDYEAIYAAIVATEEGRWFLAQYACRRLDADTTQVPEAIDRVESQGEERSAPEVAVPPLNAPPPGLDIAHLSCDLGELADALMRA